jgi:hypothetical protein
MEKSVGQSRRGIINDAYQLKMVTDHYNEADPEQKRIQLILDFTDDVAELEASGADKSDGDEEAAA